jgi:hypothetical protein
MAKKATKQTEAVTQPQQTEQAIAPNLTVQDLIIVAQIIQLSSQRGAFRAEELENIGGLYNKLIAFLESVGAITKPENAPQEK